MKPLRKLISANGNAFPRGSLASTAYIRWTCSICVRSFSSFCCCIIKGFFPLSCVPHLWYFSEFNFSISFLVSWAKCKANKRTKGKRQNNGIKLNEILNSYGAIVILCLGKTLADINSLAAQQNQFHLPHYLLYFLFFRTLRERGKARITMMYTTTVAGNSSPE